MVSKKTIIEYYDQSDVDYRLIWRDKENLAMHYGYWDRNTKTHGQSLVNMNRVLAKLARVKQKDTVLDAGCGVGGSSIWLAKNFGCKVVGITLSKKQVKMAKQFAKHYGVDHLIKFYEMDFLKTRFPPQSFDVVWAIESVCHAENKSDFIREAYRLLKPKGRIVVADGFQIKEHLNKEEQEISDKCLKGWAVPNLSVPEDFKKTMRKTGFKHIKFMNVTKNTLPSLRRLYRYSIPAMILGKPAELVGLRSKVQTGNIIAAYYQYKLVKKGIGIYGIFYGQK